MGTDYVDRICKNSVAERKTEDRSNCRGCEYYDWKIADCLLPVEEPCLMEAEE